MYIAPKCLGKVCFSYIEGSSATQHVVSVSESKWESMDMFKGTLYFYPGNR